MDLLYMQVSQFIFPTQRIISHRELDANWYELSIKMQGDKLGPNIKLLAESCPPKALINSFGIRTPLKDNPWLCPGFIAGDERVIHDVSVMISIEVTDADFQLSVILNQRVSPTAGIMAVYETVSEWYEKAFKLSIASLQTWDRLQNAIYLLTSEVEKGKPAKETLRLISILKDDQESMRVCLSKDFVKSLDALGKSKAKGATAQ